MSTKYKPNIFLFILSLLPIIIATPARFGCGLVIILLLNLIMILGTTVRFFMSKVSTGNTERLIILLFLIFITIIYKRLLVLFSPILGIILSFALYFVPLSPISLELLVSKDDYSNVHVFGKNMAYSGLYSLVLFFFFIIREFLAYGSISFPVRSGIIPFEYFPWHSSFWATISGGFILISIIYVILMFVDKKLETVRKQ